MIPLFREFAHRDVSSDVDDGYHDEIGSDLDHVFGIAGERHQGHGARSHDESEDQQRQFDVAPSRCLHQLLFSESLLRFCSWNSCAISSRFARVALGLFEALRLDPRSDVISFELRQILEGDRR